MEIREYLSTENISARNRAEAIHLKLFGEPKTHKEVAERFNTVWEIKEIIRHEDRNNI